MNRKVLYHCVVLGMRRLDISEVLSVLNCERRTFEVDCGETEKFYYVRHKKSCLLQDRYHKIIRNFATSKST